MTDATVLVTTPMFARYAPEARELLESAGCEFVHLSREEAADDATLYEHLPDADAWIVGYTTVDAAALDRAPDLRVVAKHGTGVDNVDVDAAADRGVVVANAPGANANGVAELVVALALNHLRDLVGSAASVAPGHWTGPVGRELSDRTLGVVGLGDVGQALVRRTRGFDLEYLATDAADRSAFADRHGVEMVELETLLARADVVTTHLPLTPATRGMIGEAELAAMRSDACLINTARGGVVDEAALARALADDEIGGAALDVLESEPPTDEFPYDALLADDRVTITPHVGGRTEEAMGGISTLTARNVRAVLAGDDPVHRVG